MKIITNTVSENHSLDVAKSFSKGTEFQFETEFNSESDELVLYIPNLESTLFSAEFVSDLYGSFEYFNQMYKDMIMVCSNCIEFYQYPEPTIIHFAGSRLWRTSSRIPQETILFGKEKDICFILNTEEKNLYNNGIFYSGKYTIISPLPSVIVDTNKEQLPTINSAMFNVESYKDMINQIPSIKEPIEEINE